MEEAQNPETTQNITIEDTTQQETLQDNPELPQINPPSSLPEKPKTYSVSKNLKQISSTIIFSMQKFKEVNNLQESDYKIKKSSYLKYPTQLDFMLFRPETSFKKKLFKIKKSDLTIYSNEEFRAEILKRIVKSNKVKQKYLYFGRSTWNSNYKLVDSNLKKYHEFMFKKRAYPLVKLSSGSRKYLLFKRIYAKNFAKYQDKVIQNVIFCKHNKKIIFRFVYEEDFIIKDYIEKDENFEDFFKRYYLIFREFGHSVDKAYMNKVMKGLHFKGKNNEEKLKYILFENHFLRIFQKKIFGLKNPRVRLKEFFVRNGFVEEDDDIDFFENAKIIKFSMKTLKDDTKRLVQISFQEEKRMQIYFVRFDYDEKSEKMKFWLEEKNPKLTFVFEKKFRNFLINHKKKIVRVRFFQEENKPDQLLTSLYCYHSTKGILKIVEFNGLVDVTHYEEETSEVRYLIFDEEKEEITEYTSLYEFEDDDEEEVEDSG